jgi:hypothetical protein
MHCISHEHLMHTKVGYQPERVEDKMSTASLAACLIVFCHWSWSMCGAVLSPVNNLFSCCTSEKVWQIDPRSNCAYFPAPSIHGFDTSYLFGKESSL